MVKLDAHSNIKRSTEMDWVWHYVTKVIVPHKLLSRLLQLSLERCHSPDQLIKYALQIASFVETPELYVIVFINEHNEGVIFIAKYTTWLRPVTSTPRARDQWWRGLTWNINWIVWFWKFRKGFVFAFKFACKLIEKY